MENLDLQRHCKRKNEKRREREIPARTPSITVALCGF